MIYLFIYLFFVICVFYLVEGGPDLLGTVYSPRGNITVQPPCLDVSAFNPRSRLLITPKEKRR